MKRNYLQHEVAERGGGQGEDNRGERREKGRTIVERGGRRRKAIAERGGGQGKTKVEEGRGTISSPCGFILSNYFCSHSPQVLLLHDLVIPQIRKCSLQK